LKASFLIFLTLGLIKQTTHLWKQKERKQIKCSGTPWRFLQVVTNYRDKFPGDGFPSPRPMESFGCPNFPPWIRQFHSKGSMDLALEGNDEGPGDPLRESKLLAGPTSDVLGQLGFHPQYQVPTHKRDHPLRCSKMAK